MAANPKRRTPTEAPIAVSNPVELKNPEEDDEEEV